MTTTVAFISPQKASDYSPIVDVVQDCNGNNFMHIEEAESLMAPGDYIEMTFDSSYIGLPLPKKRK